MSLHDYYMNLPHDMSGSRSKNRFRLELLWGVSKILDLMEQSEDFTAVFDCACDIEIHKEDSYEFYQIKTHKGFNNYTADRLLKKEGEGSILGKLYLLAKDDEEGKIRVAIVSNIPYKDFKKDQLIRSFSYLEKSQKLYIENKLKEELKIQSIDFESIFYIYTQMNLESPEEEIQGKLVMSFAKIKKCEPVNPNALYRLILETVEEKACYEYTDTEYQEIIKHKGISRKEFDLLLDCHSQNEKTGIQQTEEYISNMENIITKHKYKMALGDITKTYPKSKELQCLEKKIIEWINEQQDIGNMEEAIDLLAEQFHSQFSVEYDNAEKTVFYIMVLKKYEAGAYDDEIDI